MAQVYAELANDVNEVLSGEEQHAEMPNQEGLVQVYHGKRHRMVRFLQCVMVCLIFGILLDLVGLFFGMYEMQCFTDYGKSLGKDSNGNDKCWHDTTYRTMRALTLLGLGYSLFNLHLFMHILKAVQHDDCSKMRKLILGFVAFFVTGAVLMVMIKNWCPSQANLSYRGEMGGIGGGFLINCCIACYLYHYVKHLDQYHDDHPTVLMFATH